MNRQHRNGLGECTAGKGHPLWRGFTLIELLVVVVIIAVVSAILLPVFLQAVDKARKQEARQLVASQEIPAEPTKPALPAGPLPVVDAVDLKMALKSSYHRIGMDVFTRFQVDCTGQVVFRRPAGGDKDRVALFIPFPNNTLEARDVELTIRRPSIRAPIPLTDVAYSRSGISCLCPIDATEALTATVRFTALGREQFDYALPPSHQLRAVSITLDLVGTEAHTIPDDSLQPSVTRTNQIRWEFKNLVSDRQITVLIPGAEAPLARVLLLLRLVALGVLLFGAGFWYLSEQVTPGRLDSFRLGHFLLLALTYSLFFVIFAVLGFHGSLSTPVSMLLSFACSLPLLIFHVSRVLDFRFALTRVAPLALFTVAVVINGVYGGDLRDYVFLGAVIFCLAYVTLSYPAWAAGRERYRDHVQAVYRERREVLSERVVMGLRIPMAELSGEDARAEDYVQAAGREDPAARSRLELAREPVKGLLEAYQELTKGLSSLPTTLEWTPNSAGNTLCTDFERKLDAFQNRLAPRLEHLQTELAAFQASQKRLQDLQAERAASQAFPKSTASLQTLLPGEAIHCLACGHTVPEAPFCSQCGAPQPRILSCTACEERTVVPIHLLPADLSIGRLFCPRCGTKLPPLI